MYGCSPYGNVAYGDSDVAVAPPVPQQPTGGGSRWPQHYEPFLRVPNREPITVGVAAAAAILTSTSVTAWAQINRAVTAEIAERNRRAILYSINPALAAMDYNKRRR